MGEQMLNPGMEEVKLPDVTAGGGCFTAKRARSRKRHVDDN
jgi:hypothetical protein